MDIEFSMPSLLSGPAVPSSPMSEGDETSEKEFYSNPKNFGDYCLNVTRIFLMNPWTMIQILS